MSSPAQTARSLIERTGTNPVISLYFDLDPEQFGTAPARASQARSLIDEARRAAEPLSLHHDGRQALDADLDRVQEALGSDDLPVSGAQALAVFCSGPDDLFEIVALATPTPSCVYVEPKAVVEPLVTAPSAGGWCVVLVSTEAAEILEGAGRELTARTSSDDYVRGRDQSPGGETNTRDQDIAGHLKQVAEELHRRWQRDHFDLLAIAGPVEAASGLESHLHSELEAIYAGRLSLDTSAASDADVVAAVAQLAATRHAQRRDAALAEVVERMGGGQRVAVGVHDVDDALVQRRVETLLVSRDFDDGENRREAVVQTAVLQDAAVYAFDDPVDALPPARPIAALLRF